MSYEINSPIVITDSSPVSLLFDDTSSVVTWKHYTDVGGTFNIGSLANPDLFTVISADSTVNVNNLGVRSPTDKVIIKADGSTASYSLTLPTTQGKAGNVLGNTGSGKLSWFPIAIQHGMAFSFFDDFVGEVLPYGTTSWVTALLGTGTGILLSSGMPGNWNGAIDLLRGIVVSGYSMIKKTVGFVKPGIGSITSSFSVFTDASLPTGAQTYTVRAGFGENTILGSAPTSGIYFSFDQDNANFVINCTSGGTTSTITSVVVAASTWYVLGIDCNDAGTLVSFYINGTLVGTIATNIPAGKIYTFCQISGGILGLLNRQITIDYIGVTQVLTAARY
jgi:hypothetical protein